MFNLNDFVMRTVRGMIGNEPDYKVGEYALKWYSKGVLTAEDLAELDALIAAQYQEPAEEPEQLPEELPSEDM